MTVTQREVKSHEYKIMLKANKFNNVDQRELHKPANRFWKKLDMELAAAGGAATTYKKIQEAQRPQGAQGELLRHNGPAPR